MHSFLFSLLLVVFRSRRAVFYPQIFLKSQKTLYDFSVLNHTVLPRQVKKRLKAQRRKLRLHSNSHESLAAISEPLASRVHRLYFGRKP